MTRWLFGPFRYVAGAQALLWGLLGMAVTVAVSCFSHVRLDGVLDVHLSISAWRVYATEQVVCWAVASVLFFVAGVLFSRSAIRLIDVAGTMALARWPALIISLSGFAINDKIVNMLPTASPATVIHSLDVPFILAMLVQLACLVWMVALMYNAFSISCNMKGGKAAAVFVITLLLAETACKTIFHFL